MSMASTTNSSSKATPHPSTVGNSFVKQYYHLLAKNPETLHRFYKDDSKFTHGHGSQQEEPISGQKKINDKIMSMGYAGARVDLEYGSVDCQASLNGGVAVMVSGIITLKEQQPKAFVQTFFLAVQPNGYFVLNDAFRYLETPQHLKTDVVPVVPTVPAVETTSTGTTTATLPVPQPPLPPVAAPLSPKAKAKPSTPKGKKKTTKEVVKAVEVQQEAPLSPVAVKQEEEPAPVVAEEVSSAPKSWASHLFSGAKPVAAATAATTAATAAAPTKTAKKVSSNKNGWSDETPVANGEASAPKEKGTFKNKGVLFVRDLQPHTKDSDLRMLFQEFGNITAINVVQNRGYGFVDFDSMEAVKAVLSGGKQFTLFDKPISVEERHPERRDAGGRGGYSSYRGGGRGNGRGGQRAGRMDRGGRGRGGDKGGRRGGRSGASSGPNASSRMD